MFTRVDGATTPGAPAGAESAAWVPFVSDGAAPFSCDFGTPPSWPPRRVAARGADGAVDSAVDDVRKDGRESPASGRTRRVRPGAAMGAEA